MCELYALGHPHAPKHILRLYTRLNTYEERGLKENYFQKLSEEEKESWEGVKKLTERLFPLSLAWRLFRDIPFVSFRGKLCYKVKNVEFNR